MMYWAQVNPATAPWAPSSPHNKITMLDEDFDDSYDYNDWWTITEKFVCTTQNSINNFYFYFWFLDNLESFEV